MSKTRKLAYVALLGALSFVLMLVDFPIIPGADFLKVELSILPILVGLTLFGLKEAYVILVLRTLLKLVLNNQGISTLIGLPMNVLALGVFILFFSLIWKKEKTRLQFVLSGLLGTLSLTGVMLLLNYFYAIPLYATFANFDIEKFIGIGRYMIGMVLPFNLIQGLIFTLSFALLYLSLKPLLLKYSYEK